MSEQPVLCKFKSLFVLMTVKCGLKVPAGEAPSCRGPGEGREDVESRRN